MARVEAIDRDGSVMAVTGTASPGDIEASLPPLPFFRINRTEIVAREAIAHLAPRKDRLVLKVRGVPGAIAVSTHRTPALRKSIGLT